jgi:hypothetical protein
MLDQSKAGPLDGFTSPIDAVVGGTMTEAEFLGRCRNLAISDALGKVTEAILHDSKADQHVANHLNVAKDALLDALSQIAEREGV